MTAWFTLYPRRWTLRAARAVGRRWRSYRTRREARRSIVPNRRWHPWRVSLGRLLRVFAFVGTALLLTWIALAAYDSSQNERSWFHDVREAAWFSTVLSFVSPVLTGALLLAVFLLYWYHKAKRPLVRKARTRPHELVPTAGTLVDRIVGRRELAQVMAQTLRNRETRRPYLLVGGVGVGKTAVLVELTRMLAQQSAVPVPLRLRDMDGEFDFEQMARRRFAEEADQGVFAAGNIDKAWRQLRLDDKAVVIADGLEEALLDERYREDRDNIIRRAIDRADRQQLPLVIASRPHAPLEGTRAAITDLEPLSEEAALEYLVREPGEGDERRLDWVVETAEVSDSPIYLRITRALQQRGLLEHLTLRENDGRLNTRSNDCSTIRLWLLDSYRRAMEDGLIRDKLVMDRRERRETLWVDGTPDAIEERLELTDRSDLPPCLTHDRTPLHPERSVGRNDQDEPGFTCLPTCTFRLCPYPPKAARTQKEIEEPFCRQQQALLHSHRRWHLPAFTRRTAPWVSIPVRELQAFWEVMAHRKRKAPEEDEQVL
ncbi:hypothetical protein ACPCKW_03155 [Streptomyces griseoincarnatus]